MIQKQAIDVSFAQGVDTKTDPKRVQMGKFIRLENTIFDKGGLLQKRNGYPKLTSLPDTTYSYLTTFNSSLTAIGPNIAALNTGNDSWVQRGKISPLSLSTLPLIRNNLNQTAVDSVVAPNGLVCSVYLETDGTTITNKYAIADSVTGQNIVAPTTIPVASGTVSGGMRVFLLSNNFIIVFTNTITATPHLQYITINSNSPTVVTANVDIFSSYVPATTLSWDGYVVDNNLYIAFNTTSGGQQMKVCYLTLSQANSGSSPTAFTSFAAEIATMVSVTADTTNVLSPVIWVSYYDSSSQVGKILALDKFLSTLKAATSFITATALLNITSAAQNGTCRIFKEVSNIYTMGALNSNFISARDVTLSAISASFNVIRSVGLASKAFIIDGIGYFLATYSSLYQPTYFLINGSTSTQAAPIIAAKLAYSNGGGYLTKGLPGVSVSDTAAWIPYLFKDLIQAANKDTNVSSGTQVNGIYSQTGLNLTKFVLGTSSLDTVEIGNNLHISGGFLTMYDGYLPVEHNFFLWPDAIFASPGSAFVWSTTGGSMAAKPDAATNTNAYYYQITYEWTDNQGNAFRSAPSIPVAVTTSGAASTGSVTITLPTLRLTMKVSNPVKLVIYRWSVGQQNYYQTTSISAPLLNDTTVDTVTFVDTNADSTILGNSLIYTTGGVVEDVNAPASNVLTLFDTRLWLVDAEDPNLLWYSKQVIEATPVEMSDLFTLFVPPTTSTQGSTGPITGLFPMDDKLLIAKENAFLYINGSGPDNTGANSQYSQPTFIAGTVGCTNQKSFVLMPQGTMFQSDKGIWLLDRSLQTSYIGAPVEDFTIGANVLSAVNVPETNQVRFILDSGITLMFDYYYNQWGVFTGVPAISSCIFQGMHTFINSFGAAYQERSNYYLDGSNPVLMAFQTGPLRLGDLQGYQRAYFFYLLGTFISPHKLELGISYDYETLPSQTVLIIPTNYSTPYGSGSSQSPYGEGDPYGGGSNLESWRVFLERQRCMAFAISLQEIFDASQGTQAGAGLTLSGLNIVMGFKKDFRPQEARNSVG